MTGNSQGGSTKQSYLNSLIALYDEITGSMDEGRATYAEGSFILARPLTQYPTVSTGL